MRIELEVDELVLDGFNPHQHFRIRAVAERELVRLFSAERGLPPALRQSREMGYLDAGTFEAAPGVTGEAVGSGVARAMCGALRR